jgi:dienelactone hydrolase
MTPDLSAHDLLEDLLRRLLRAEGQKPVLRPWVPGEKAQILERGRGILGIDFAWTPQITTSLVRTIPGDGYTVECLQARSWEGCHGAAHLYLPAGAPQAGLPCVLLCCGHGRGGAGKLTPGYQAMARTLVAGGMAVLVPDNIGHGERKPMGHQHPVKPFACGTSVQGLIVLETLGWLDWMSSDPRFDVGRLAAIGNSGGGLLTMWLGAFAQDRLAAVASSAYPNSISYIAQKEKAHCHCNILPGMVGSLEMWQLYGCMAPRPLYLYQGDQDEFFPVETFMTNARRTFDAYQAQGCAETLRYQVVQGEHRWDAQRRVLTAEFLAPILGTEVREPAEDAPPLGEEAHCHPAWPGKALTTDELAEALTGTRVPDSVKLWDVYGIPEVREEGFPFERGSVRQIAAQFAAFTCRDLRL